MWVTALVATPLTEISLRFISSPHSVFHPVECSYCRSESMMGFRYRCQQCHGYQLCQSCFWRGHANGPHSNQHQMKEHSSWVRWLAWQPCRKESLHRSHSILDHSATCQHFLSSPNNPRGILWAFYSFRKLNCIDWIYRVAAFSSSSITTIESIQEKLPGLGPKSNPASASTRENRCWCSVRT